MTQIMVKYIDNSWKKRIEQYCQTKHIAYKMYFYHSKIRKNKKIDDDKDK